MSPEEFHAIQDGLADAFAQWAQPVMLATSSPGGVLTDADIPGLLAAIPSCPEDAEAALDLHHLSGGITWGEPLEVPRG